MRPRPPHALGSTGARLAVLTALWGYGCGAEAPAVLEVGSVGYSAEQLVGLSDSRRDLLSHVTALGLVLSESSADPLVDDAASELVAPIVERLEVERLHTLLGAREFLQAEGIDEASVAAAYRAEPEFELTVRHLIVLSARYESEAQRTAARDKAARALERIRAGEPFPEVAAEVSEEPGAEGRQGLLAPGREGAWVGEFWAAASALEVGGISPVVETQYGFHVLRLEGREPVPFDEVRDQALLAAAELRGFRPTPLTSAPRPDSIRFANDVRTAREPESILATFDGGEVRYEDLLRLAAAQGGPSWDGLRGGDAELRGRLLDLALVDAGIRTRAARAGVVLDPLLRDEMTREEALRVEQTGQLLGLLPGVRADEVAELALAALGRSGQNAESARSTLRGWRGLLQLHVGYGAPEMETPSRDGP